MSDKPRLGVLFTLFSLVALNSNVSVSHAKAGSSFGPAVDAACQSFNGTTPFADQSCALCHNPTDFGQRIDPEWGWWESGNFTAFCPEPVNQAPNGTIDSPTSNLTVTAGEAVTFNGSGSDPDGNLPLTYAWDFDGAAANSSAEDPGSITFNTAGTFTVSLVVTDSLGLSDSTPATRRITVNDAAPTCTDADGDGFSIEGGSCGPVDCNDGNAAINPGAEESCSDGIDNNCNGLIDNVDPVAVNCPISQACIDNDNDMFSPEGGICGPIDCDDFDAAVNPGAPESCGDDIDNDCNGAIDGNDPECNGGDCLAQLFSDDGGNGGADFRIQIADWDAHDRKLEVEGDKAPRKARVKLFNAKTGKLLKTTKVEDSGEWKFEVDKPNPVPCSIRVEIGDQSAVQDVTNAPAGCDNSATGSNVKIKKAKWNKKKRRLRVEGHKAPAGALVKIRNMTDGELLGTTTVKRDGKWKFKAKTGSAPCRIRAEIKGQSGERNVKGAPEKLCGDDD
ncbi:MAG: PKD domain-containing protein [Chromatiales bacterium]|nr:PKD domain-containing protein [Chromatiales bacterium]